MAKKVKFQAFVSGVCSLWQLDNNRKPILLLKNLRYQDRVVGERRSFDAEQNGHIVKKLIRVPRMDFIKAGVFVTIGQEQYKVLLAQNILETVPLSIDLTLENPGIMLHFDEAEAGAGGRV